MVLLGVVGLFFGWRIHSIHSFVQRRRQPLRGTQIPVLAAVPIQSCSVRARQTIVGVLDDIQYCRFLCVVNTICIYGFIFRSKIAH